MLTVVIIVAAVIVVAVAAYALMRRENTGPALKKRFGPEYDRTLARHNGDTAAARQELGERVKRHGSLKERPLDAESLARYEAEWAGVQRRFVDSPQQAMADSRRAARPARPGARLPGPRAGRRADRGPVGAPRPRGRGVPHRPQGRRARRRHRADA
ncbi:hypothetical protein NQP46_29290 [Streptomyces albus]|nr:hypothetical protein NQP46_29290 [Streptomyces albus]